MTKLKFSIFFILFSIAAYCQQNSTVLKPSAEEALVYVVRPTNMGFAVGFSIACDDILLGKTKGKSYVYGFIEPGTHKILASGGEKDAELEINVEAGKTYYVEQKIKMGVLLARTKLELLTEEEGLKALAKCKPAKAKDNVPSSQKTTSSNKTNELNQTANQDQPEKNQPKKNIPKKSGPDQALDNVKTSFDGERVTITYDLNHTDGSRKFNVVLYSSHNNYGSPVVSLTGHVGENVLPGKTKRVAWEVRKDLPPDFDTDVVIKVKATEAIRPLAATPLARKAYKKGQQIQVQWQGGRPTDKLNIELLKDGAVQQKLAENVNNSQAFTWSVPKEMKGKGYSLKISNAAEQSSSDLFRIRRKVPLVFIIAPVALIGGAVALLGGGEKPGETASDLPGPVKPN
jgi:hypothetical protein